MGPTVNPNAPLRPPAARTRYRAPAWTPPPGVTQPTFVYGPSTTENNPMRKLAFYAGLAMLLTTCCILPELLFDITHTDTYLLYLVYPPALFGAFLTGSIKRTFGERAAWYWFFFFLWMVVAVPFSSWRGQSFMDIYGYARINIPLLIIVGGLATTWQEVRTMLYTMGISGLITVIASRSFTTNEGGRVSMGNGSIGNPNDLAAHLVMFLPFMALIVIDPKRNIVFRLGVLLPAIGYGLYLILGTASRGGLLSLVAMFLVMLWGAPGAKRVMVLALAAILALALPALLPDSTRQRLASLMGAEHEEAKESQQSREYLFKKSVTYTLEHPLVGVGPNQFANYEGKQSISEGKIGNWHATHCAFTQVSSECGVPALLFFLLSIGSALGLVLKTHRQARRLGYKEIQNTCLCYIVSLIGFMVSITFLANAYRFYLPVMVGVAIVMTTVARKIMNPVPAPVAVPTAAPRPFAVR